MSVGARDIIDQLLVKKYANEQVDNHTDITSMIDPNKMMEAMNDVASVQRNMFMLSQRLNMACAAINAKRARYRDREREMAE